MQKDILQKWFFPQPPGEVWEYLTNAELIEQWLMKTDFQPIVGHQFRFIHLPKNESNYDGIIYCEVLEVNPVTKLSYSWKGKTKDGNRTFNSNVVWTLIPKENGTELQLQHTGFILLEDCTSHNIGWSACLRRFEELLKQPNNANI